jgi:hypothetical protein
MKFDTKIEKRIIVFYILYFVWLYIITFLTGQTVYLTAFSSVVVAFYFAFLRQAGDLLFFLLGTAVPVLFAFFSLTDSGITYTPENLAFLPIWFPLAWGTTVVAIRQLVSLISPRYSHI